MLKIQHLKIKGFETVVVGKDPSAHFHAIIAVHSTRLGPSLGGIRMWPYKNEKEALQDVLRLAQAMSKKAAISGLQIGGGKAVIIGNPGTDKTRSVLLLMGMLIDSLKGKYIAAKDSGIVPEDLDVVAEKTRHVTGTTGKNGGSGDPSLSTAKGVLGGMQAACQVVFGSQDLKKPGGGDPGGWPCGAECRKSPSETRRETDRRGPAAGTSHPSATILECRRGALIEDSSCPGGHLCALCPGSHTQCQDHTANTSQNCCRRSQ